MNNKRKEVKIKVLLLKMIKNFKKEKKMKKLSLMLAVLFLFSGLCFAGRGYTCGNTTKSDWKYGHKTVTTGMGDGTMTRTYKEYNDGSSLDTYKWGNGEIRTIRHNK